MPRIGRNPLKRIGTVRPAADVTAAVVVCIPELEGYWEEALDVLRLCLDSMLDNAGMPVDLVVFDNASCGEVRSYLREMQSRGRIQYLILSEENVGRPGAIDYLFRFAPGKIIAFTDSDVLFYPGWLRESIRVLEAFEGTGMVSGRPWRPVDTEEAELARENSRLLKDLEGVGFREGDLVPLPVLEEHAASIGAPVPDLTALGVEDLRVERGGVGAFGYGSHFQFVTTAEAARAVGRTQISLKAAGLGSGSREWDRRLSRLGYVRLALETPLVRHLGNSLSGERPADLPTEGGGRQPTRPARREKLPLLAALFRLLTFVPLVKPVLNRIQVRIYQALHSGR